MKRYRILTLSFWLFFFEVPKVVQKRGQYLHFSICPDVRWAKRVRIYNTYLCTVLPCLFFLPKVIRYVQLTLTRPWPLYSDKCLCIMWCKYVCTSFQQWMLTVIRNDCIYIKNEKCCKTWHVDNLCKNCIELELMGGSYPLSDQLIAFSLCSNCWQMWPGVYYSVKSSLRFIVLHNEIHVWS